ncbi:hypothetical protein EVG20_g8876, partial [Dentipellis fragilis]
VVPNILEKNVTPTHPLVVGCFIIVSNRIGKKGGRTYVGEVLDIYQKGSSSRYGSIEFAKTTSVLSSISARAYLPVTLKQGRFFIEDNGESESGSDDESVAASKIAPAFSCHHPGQKAELHTHVKASHLVYNLGMNALSGEDRANMRLTSDAEKRWLALASKKAGGIIRTALTIRIPGGQMVREAP